MEQSPPRGRLAIVLTVLQEAALVLTVDPAAGGGITTARR